METLKLSAQWRFIGHSERGASHFRQGLPNQDAIKAECVHGSDPIALVAVSDGHGSPKSFRSDVGSQIAVDVTVATLREFLRGVRETPSPSIIKNIAEQKLPIEIYKAWRAEVQRHLDLNPIQDDEWNRLESESGPSARTALTSPGKEFVVYGATVLAAVVTDTFIVFVQLGDGEILTVPIRGELATRPMPADSRLLANETTSLCEEDAWKNFRVRFQNLSSVPPCLILLTTDGYPNSFETPDGFLKCGSDLLEILSTDGAQAVERDLPNWLSDASRLGSGDDVTVGILFQLNSVSPPSAGEQPGSVQQPHAIKTSGVTQDRSEANSDAVRPNEPMVRLTRNCGYFGLAISCFALLSSAFLWLRVENALSRLDTLVGRDEVQLRPEATTVKNIESSTATEPNRSPREVQRLENPIQPNAQQVLSEATLGSEPKAGSRQ